jgi:pimeloyl-ACP methyl ester carboxylesterase
VALAVALDLGRRNPLSIRRLVLIDAPAYPQGDTPLMQIVQQPLLPYALLSVLSPEFSTSLALQKQIDARTIDEADIRAYASPYHDPAARHALISTARQMLPLNWPEVVAAYRTLRQPTLLVWCDRDEVVPAVTGLRLERAIPNANLKIIEGCEHSPPDEAAPELVAHMQRFLAPPQHSALARK